MTSLELQLASMVVHLAEYVETHHPTDLSAAKGLLTLPEVAAVLEPSPLLPLTRSGNSVAQIIGKLV